MSSGRKLPRSFYERPTLKVARDLLGKVLVHCVDGQARAGRIVEVEAYVGLDDRACHASRGRTRRTEVMFGPAGHAYVYLVYGMYYCLNAVTEAQGYPAAVLVRALEPLDGVAESTTGPGRLCRALSIDSALNAADLTDGTLYVEDDGWAVTDEQVAASPRIGVAYAGEWAERPWRFYVRANPWVSRTPSRAITSGERRRRSSTRSA